MKKELFLEKTLSLSRENLIILSFALLAFNFLIYSFFKIDINKNILRICTICIIVGIYIWNRRIDKYDFIYVFCALYVCALQGPLAINILFIVLFSLVVSPIDSSIRYALCVLSIVLTVVVILSLLFGIVDSKVTNYGGRIRNTLGFANVNGATLLFYSCIVLILNNQKRMNVFLLAMLGIISYYIYTLTNSRSCIYGLIIYLFVFLFCTLFRKNMKYIIRPLIILLFLFPMLCIFLSNRFPQLDYLLSFRLTIYKNYLYNNSVWSLIFGGAKGEVDCFFINLLGNCGALMYLAIGIITYIAIERMIQHETYNYVSLCISILCIGLVESTALRSEIPCMLYYWCIIIFFFKDYYHNEQSIADKNFDL